MLTKCLLWCAQLVTKHSFTTGLLVAEASWYLRMGVRMLSSFFLWGAVGHNSKQNMMYLSTPPDRL